MLGSAVKTIFILLMVTAVVPPFVSMVGPLSLDDVFPLAAVGLAIAALAFSRQRSRDGTSPLTDPSLVPFLLFAGLGLLSSAANSATLPDFLRLAGRSTGRALFYLSLILTARALLDDPRWLRRALVGFALLATLEAVFGIYAFQTSYRGPYGFGIADIPSWSVLRGHTRVHGTFSGEMNAYELNNTSSNFLAAYLLLTIPTTLGLAMAARRGRWQLAIFAGAALQVVTLYLTYTRAALVALGGAVLVMGWLMGRRRMAAGVVALGVLATLAIPTMRAKFTGESHDRYALWWSGIQITADHPVLGIGDGNYMPVLYGLQRYHDTPYGISTSTAHNSILLSAANHGLLGGAAHLLIYALMIGVAVRAVRESFGPARAIAIGLAGGLAGYLIQDQFNNLAYVPKVATQMWFLFALIPLVPRCLSPSPARVSRVAPEGALGRPSTRLTGSYAPP